MIPIARGSFGEVYKSTYKGVQIAIKHIRTGSGYGGQTHDPLIREALLELSILTEISHPNVVLFCGTCLKHSSHSKAGPWIGLVFELCEGGSLHDAIHKGRHRLTPARRVAIAHHVAEGMSYLHSRHILHRDLNTKNILLDADLTPKIADFGCSVRPPHPPPHPTP